ncbi:MAG: cobalt-precorrin-5B (C(1))-methyltransferase [Actinoallomurus sp.]
MADRQKAPRTGWTTGMCASAAATAPATRRAQGAVEVAPPSGRRATFAVESCLIRADRAETVVIKDAGDDPDVTHGARLTATASWRDEPGIALEGGIGVGVVTKPGLGLELGGPAINPVSRKMTEPAVGESVDLKAQGVRVEQAVAVMAAQGEKTLVLCTGGRTEKGAMRLLPQLPGVCFVEVGDFTGAALRRAVEHGIRQVVFVGMAGKLTRLASGVLMTHYTRSTVDTELLAEITREMGGSEELTGQVAAADTARHAYELWEAEGLLGRCGRELCRRVAGVLEEFTESGVAAQVVLVDFTGERMIAMYGRLSR